MDANWLKFVLRQLHDRACFEPIDEKILTATEAKRVLDSFVFLVEKKVDHDSVSIPDINHQS